MIVIAHEWIGFKSLVRKEIARFAKVSGQTLFSPLVNAGLYLLVFGVSLSAMLKEHQGVTYLQFLIPGLIALSSLNNAIQNSSSSVMISKFHGDLQDLKLIPLSSVSIMIAYVFACIVRGVIVAGLVFLLGEVFSFFNDGSFMMVSHPFSFFIFLCMSCAVFGNLGITSGFLAKSFDQINAFTTFVIVPLIYLGGVFFSLNILSPFWQGVSRFNPVVYIINGIRWSMLGVSDVPVQTCFLVLGIFVVLSSGISWAAVRYGSYQRF